MTANTAAFDPASVLTPADLAVARAVAADAPTFTPSQRDLLSNIFQPSVRALVDTPQTTSP